MNYETGSMICRSVLWMSCLNKVQSVRKSLNVQYLVLPPRMTVSVCLLMIRFDVMGLPAIAGGMVYIKEPLLLIKKQIPLHPNTSACYRTRSDCWYSLVHASVGGTPYSRPLFFPVPDTGAGEGRHLCP